MPYRRIVTTGTILLWLTSSSMTHAAFSNRVFVSTPVVHPQRVVGDCMTCDPLTLTSSTSVNEAILFLLQQKLTGAPVLEGNRLVGVISDFDFLTKEAGGTLFPMQGSKESVQNNVVAAQMIVAKNVGDIMTTSPITVDATNTMREAASIMVQNKVHHLPVINEEGGLVGILSSLDIMMDVHNAAMSALPKGEEDATKPNQHLSP